MKTVKEVSDLTGVSIRTLHHYDAIGLLKPAQVTQAGYRLYDDAALGRLQNILLFRQLRFSLKEIRDILDSPNFDPVSALEQQIRMLELQREHLDRVIEHARQLRAAGGYNMEFKPYDTTAMDDYAAQAKARWGATAAYQEFEKKTAGQTKQQQKAAGDDLMAIFARLGQLRHLPPEDPSVQALIEELQAFITGHYYTCTPQILRGLGQMYIAGDSMTENIDKAGGPGTAELAHKAIEIYTR